MTNHKPKRETRVFREGQVEEHEIGLIFEPIECPTCDGSGEEESDWEGIQSYEECTDCGGSGVFYVSID
jgi:DnaJ-class molecular chaperone